jgi:hypothetical protein
MAAEVDPRFAKIFPKKSDYQHYKTYELLDYAYIGACHDVKFKISGKQLEYLAPLGMKVLELTKEVCSEEIHSLESEIKSNQ